jgi:hypothetical protein
MTATKTRQAVSKKTTTAVIDHLIEEIGKKLPKEAKASVGDYIRLLQLKRDLEGEQVKEIRVKWIQGAGEEAGDCAEECVSSR